MMEIIKLIINFIWQMANINFSIGGYNITYFQMISFSIIVGLILRIALKGGAKSDGK